MHPLVSRIVEGDRRAVARGLTIVENNADGKRSLLQGLYPHCGKTHVVGITGSPGAGKSSLVDGLIRHLRGLGLTVGVLAVDPSSPFTGGALLGDRVRMTQHSADKGVYIRSMGSRGSLGGLARGTREMGYVLEASGCDVILLETVGVGQAELDVMSVADSVALVLTPGAGDAVQAAKAGIMEIADLFVVNKADLPGADALIRELQWMIHDKRKFREEWKPPIVRTSAARSEGLQELWTTLTHHKQHLQDHGYWEARRRARHRQATLQLLEAAFAHYVHIRADENENWRAILEDAEGLDPYQALERIAEDFPWLDVPKEDGEA